MRCPRLGSLHSLVLIGGVGHPQPPQVVPELDIEWATAEAPRIKYLTIAAPGSITVARDDGGYDDYAIIGRAKSGEILAVEVQR